MSEGRCSNVTGGTIGVCTSETVAIEIINTGAIVKVPVGLAELNVQINMDSIITLPEPALEIKDIMSRVKVTQCRLLLPTNTLFIKGIVRKDINYATSQCSNLEGVCGDIRHCTVDVPFRCTTAVTYNGANPANIAFNTSREFEYLRKAALPRERFAEKDKLLAGDLSEFNQVSTQFFNELPDCKLVSARIVEYNEYLDRTDIPGAVPFEEREFIKVEEKTVISLTLKIVQKRNVSIPCGAPFSLLACPR